MGILWASRLRLVYLLVLSELGQNQMHGFAVRIWLSIDAAMMGSISTWWRMCGSAIEGTTSKYKLYYNGDYFDYNTQQASSGPLETFLRCQNARDTKTRKHRLNEVRLVRRLEYHKYDDDEYEPEV